MKFQLLFLLVALFATSSHCQFYRYQFPPLSSGPPAGPPGQWNIRQSYENYNNNPGNPGNQFPGFTNDPFYNPIIPRDPKAPEKKSYQNYNVEANYHVSSKDDPALNKDPFKSFETNVQVSHYKNNQAYSYGDV